MTARRRIVAFGAIALIVVAVVLYVPRTSSPTRLASVAARAQHVPPKDSHGWIHTVVETLAERDDAASLAAAALLIEANTVDFPTSADTRRRATLTRHAATVSPNDPAIQMLALKACRAVPECDSTAYENTLVEIDSPNAWARGASLRRALAAGDSARQAEILGHMARAQRFSSYLAQVESMLDGALRTLDIPAPEEVDWGDAHPFAGLVAQALNVSASSDTFGEVSRACLSAERDSLLQNCRAVAKLMLSSDEDMVVRSGFELSTMLFAAGSPEATEIASLQRRYDWQMYQAIRLPRSAEQDARFVKGRLGDAQLRRELLQEHGIALDPPDDWVNPFGPAR